MTFAKFKKEAFEQAEVRLEITPDEALQTFPNITGVIVFKMLEHRGWHPLVWHGKRTLVVARDE